jgi:hypothetical protein
VNRVEVNAISQESAASQSGRLRERCDIYVGLLRGVDDKTYAVGLISALVSQGVRVDYIGSDAVDSLPPGVCSLKSFYAT